MTKKKDAIVYDRSNVGRFQLNRILKRNINIDILGVGGVGSNLVKFIYCNQLITNINELTMYDADSVELHNLNRSTMFSMAAVTSRKHKVNAVRDMCYCYGSNKMNIYTITNEVDNSTTFNSRTLVIDSRDTMSPDKMPDGVWLKLAYDGGSNISFTWLPKLIVDKIVSLNTNSSYEVTPSFYVPAALLALLAAHFRRFECFTKLKPINAGTFQMNIDDIIDTVSYTWEE
jgi:hypothetical protein